MVPKGRSCVAAMSSDCVPVLVTLEAVLRLVGQNGVREIPIADYFRTDGVAHTVREAGELLTDVLIPVPATPRRTTYVKWTVRRSIDFPLISVALRFDLEKDSPSSAIARAFACCGVLAAKPKQVKQFDRLVGKSLAAQETIEEICDLLYTHSKPLENVPYEAPYRRKMIPVYVRRALAALQ